MSAIICSWGLASARFLKSWEPFLESGQNVRYLNWRRLDELRFEFSEPPRSIKVAVQSTANYVLTRDIFLLAIPTRS